MKGLEPAVPELTVMPYLFQGDEAQERLDEINNVIDSEFNGNTNLKVLSLRNVNGLPTVVGSNSLISPVVSQVIGPEGYRTIFPEELETTLGEGDPIRVRGKFYVDAGLVLDFSGKNHDLARNIFDRLPDDFRELDRLPAVMVGYGLVNSDIGSYGVAPTFVEGTTDLRTAKILAQPTGIFNACLRH